MTIEEGETIIEYPNGRTVRLSHVEAVTPLAETLEVLADPFPAKRTEPNGTFFDLDALEGSAEVVTRKKGARPLPYAAELERVRESKGVRVAGKSYDWSSIKIAIDQGEVGGDRSGVTIQPDYALAAKFDASPTGSSEAVQATNDALLAIVRLRAACEQLISRPGALSVQDCEGFVEFAKQRLNVVALACPIMKAGK